jgi:hypothetical protein
MGSVDGRVTDELMTDDWMWSGSVWYCPNLEASLINPGFLQLAG